MKKLCHGLPVPLFLFILIYPHYLNAQVALSGFSRSQYFDEQVKTFTFNPGVRIHIIAPPVAQFNPTLPTALTFFALPNGNTIEQTIGKKLRPGDDWHFDIQHIGAQTRFLRANVTNYNTVTIYLETSQKSWPSWRSANPNNAVLIKAMVDSIRNMFSAYNPFVVLTGHSGGGSFTFGFLNAVTEIPVYVKRISFLDSNYGYDNSYGPKFLNWLNASAENYLCVIAYNDSVALLNGVPVVSPTGGTWYRSRMMVSYLSNYIPVTYTADSVFLRYTALEGRVKFILKTNPTRAILHTIQVELNGFIQGMVSGTQAEDIGYTYYGPRAYSQYIQTDLPKLINIPPRQPGALTGSQFMNSILTTPFAQREEAIFTQFSQGNVPHFMRTLKKHQSVFLDASGVSHTLIYEVMPDYLCIGSDSDYCRVPMGPITAQKIADQYGMVMPTSKLVDDIYSKAGLKLAPVTYAPVGNQNEQVAKFIEHNSAIEVQRIASGMPLGTLIGGTKKDVVLSNLITDPSRPYHVVIYGWHQLNGTPIQPLTNIHINTYVDYSHGIRLLNKEVLLDSIVKTIPELLSHPTLYKVVSNESGPMTQTSYLKDSTLPATPRSFGIKANGSGSLQIVIKPDTNITGYMVFASPDGVNFPDSIPASSPTITINNLRNDSIYYIRLKAVNASGRSTASEVLACMPGTATQRYLIVHGFDRATTGNTFNFINRHAPSIKAAGKAFDSATNEALTDNLFQLSSYHAVDFILGDESTVNETFSTAEQSLVKMYLQNGGKVFVSGSEIAWDLDYKGTSTDKDFIYNYLFSYYTNDAPNNSPGVYYNAELFNLTSTGFPFSFDNGTHGTINVRYPDVIKPRLGGKPFARYTGIDTSQGVAGIYRNTDLPSPYVTGKVAVMGIPFESVYPDSVRNKIMKEIDQYFGAYVNDAENTGERPGEFVLYPNYPNPFNPITVIRYSVPEDGMVSLVIYDILGKEIIRPINHFQRAGTYEIVFNCALQSSGIYFCELRSGKNVSRIKMNLIK